MKVKYDTRITIYIDNILKGSGIVTNKSKGGMFDDGGITLWLRSDEEEKKEDAVMATGVTPEEQKRLDAEHKRQQVAEELMVVMDEGKNCGVLAPLRLRMAARLLHPDGATSYGMGWVLSGWFTEMAKVLERAAEVNK